MDTTYTLPSTFPLSPAQVLTHGLLSHMMDRVQPGSAKEAEILDQLEELEQPLTEEEIAFLIDLH